METIMGRKKISVAAKLESFLLPVEEKNLLAEAAKAKGISKSELIRLACRCISRRIIEAYSSAKKEAADEFVKAVKEKRKVDFTKIIDKHEKDTERRLNELLYKEIRERDKE